MTPKLAASLALFTILGIGSALSEHQIIGPDYTLGVAVGALAVLAYFAVRSSMEGKQ